MNRLGAFLLPMDGVLGHRRVNPSIKFAGTYLYAWAQRGTVRVKCVVQEQNNVLGQGLNPDCSIRSREY